MYHRQDLVHHRYDRLGVALVFHLSLIWWPWHRYSLRKESDLHKPILIRTFAWRRKRLSHLIVYTSKWINIWGPGVPLRIFILKIKKLWRYKTVKTLPIEAKSVTLPCHRNVPLTFMVVAVRITAESRVEASPKSASRARFVALIRTFAPFRSEWIMAGLSVCR